MWRRWENWSTGGSRAAAFACAGFYRTAGPTPTPRVPRATRSRSRIRLAGGGITFLPRGDDRVPSKALALAAREREPLRKRGIGRDPLDRRRNRRGVFGRDEQAGFAVADDVGDPADRAPDHGNAIRHCLDQHDAEALRVAAFVDDRRQDEDVRFVERAMQIRLGDAARHDDAAVEAQLSHLQLERGAIRTLAEDEEPRRNCRWQTMQRVDKESHAFARDQVADVEDQE